MTGSSDAEVDSPALMGDSACRFERFACVVDRLYTCVGKGAVSVILVLETSHIQGALTW